MKHRILSKEYWSDAAKELKNLRMLTFAALCCALSIALGSVYVLVGENLRIYITFFVKAVGCSVYGPVVGMVAAAVADPLGYVLFPSGPYFPGYMLTEILGALIFGCMFYRRSITVIRVYGAKFLVNYLVNVLLGCLWSKILYGQGYLYYLVKSLVKNTLLLPLEVIALSALFGGLIPVFHKFQLLPHYEEEQLQALHRPMVPVLGISFLLAGLCCGYYWTQGGGMVFSVLGIGLLFLGTGSLVYGFLRNRKQS